jgi:ketosteroid isomerase-like protein
MKNIFLFMLSYFMVMATCIGQEIIPDKKQSGDIYALIDNYSLARENKDAVLLESILTTDVDQLVSSGRWRNGKNESIEGMLQSSSNNPGTRTLTIDKIRLFNQQCAIVDARYEIKNPDGTSRKMWSTFIVVFTTNEWKISAIRNMLPSG